MAQKKFNPIEAANPTVLTVIDTMVDNRMARMNENYAAIFVSNTDVVYRRFFHTLEEFKAYVTMSKQSRSKSRLVAYYQRSEEAV